MPRWRIFPIGKVWSGIIPVAWLAFAGWSFAAESTIRIPHVNRAPKLADFLQGAPREKEMSIRAFRQHKPYDGQVVSATTVAHLSYDAQTLYVVFECHADRKTLRAHLSKRDDVAEDETVSISIDTFHDRRHAYMFFVNPLGVQMDGLTTEGQDDDFSFDAVWRSEGKLTSDGYITMIAIPFKSIRFKKGTNHTWGFSLSRYIPERNELSTFPYIAGTVKDTWSSSPLWRSQRKHPRNRPSTLRHTCSWRVSAFSMTAESRRFRVRRPKLEVAWTGRRCLPGGSP
jgi:hypothetical protein